MTEQEWLECTYPAAMVHNICFKIRPGDRKKRLFANHCCRSCWDLFTDKRSQLAVEASERFAEGEATRQDLTKAGGAAWEVVLEWRATLERRPKGLNEEEEQTLLLAAQVADIAWLIAGEIAFEVLLAMAAACESLFGKNEEMLETTLKSLCDVLRDIFGIPFSPKTQLNSSWLTWSDAAIPKLAMLIYNERAFDRLPILADALEDAGRDNEDILNHCRSEGPHVRGCWVVDLLLGKS